MMFEIPGREPHIFVRLALTYCCNFDADVFDRNRTVGAYEAGLIEAIGANPEGLPSLISWNFDEESLEKILEFVSKWADVPPEIVTALKEARAAYDRKIAAIGEQVQARMAEIRKQRGV